MGYYQEENMYGLAAIQQANGWAMAGAGACIVLTGLTVLSFLISMIPRLTGLFEEKKQPQTETAGKGTRTKADRSGTTAGRH
jgi:hypothetical protein